MWRTSNISEMKFVTCVLSGCPGKRLGSTQEGMQGDFPGAS